ncbi:hypothetical protein F2Q70_00031668 [Brassica cretica]|uniref:Uncharacterized protein n=1 Tax=Brassica cretica TaxID=69181 RepID=A0A8S9FSK0_BRACR|nr:hypothetical protein F2Q70_00031668 [Brassica cretica]
MYFKSLPYSIVRMLSVTKGSPLRGSFPGSGQAAGRLYPGGYVLSPKAQYPLRDMDEQFASGWRRTQKHDIWPPRL